MKVRYILQRLEKDGRMLAGGEGSDHRFIRATKTAVVTIAYDQEGDEIMGKPLASHSRQAGWK